jgi:hypothetical protein
MPVRETRRLIVRDVIVSADDVRLLSRIISDAASELGTPRTHFTVSAFDASEYEGSSNSLFQEGGLLETKQIRSIGMFMANQATDAEVRVRICHETTDYGGSEVTVSGYDSTWVNGVMARLEDAINGWQEQASWPRRFRWLFVILAALGIGYIYSFALDLVFDHIIHIQPIRPRPAWADSLQPAVPFISLIANFMVGIWPSLLLMNRLPALWPRVEICTGKEYARVASTRRRYAWAVFSLIMLPLLLSAVYDGIKSLFAKL